MLHFLRELSYPSAFTLFFFENLFIVVSVVIIGYWIQKKLNKQLVFSLTKKEIFITVISLVINSGITCLGYFLWMKDIIRFNAEFSVQIIIDFFILLLV